MILMVLVNNSNLLWPISMQMYLLIIMYHLTGIRDEERQILEQTGYFQSITVGVAPIVVVIASVATFSTHMLLGYDLTAAQVGLHCLFGDEALPQYWCTHALTLLHFFFQAFTVVTVFNAMTFALKVTPFSVKSLSEASVAIDRFKVSFLSFFLQIVTSSFVKFGSVYFACCSHRDPVPVNPGIGASVIIEVCLIWSRWMILGNWLNKMGMELFLVPYWKAQVAINPADYIFVSSVSDFSGRYKKTHKVPYTWLASCFNELAHQKCWRYHHKRAVLWRC